MTQLHIIPSCPSTNSAMPADAPHGYCLMALEQTAGRGQRGNSWEAAPGQNITMSLMLRPEAMRAVEQFRISQAVALAVARTVRELGVDRVTVKWPNDIYVGDMKICGILIENSLAGPMITRSVAGIGLNVNQREFTSPAPNPVSLRQLLGRDLALEPLARRIADTAQQLLQSDPHRLAADYRAMLWRGTGTWPWRPADGSPIFHAPITDILPTGHIVLGTRPFAFKEVFPA